MREKNILESAEVDDFEQVKSTNLCTTSFFSSLSMGRSEFLAGVVLLDGLVLDDAGGIPLLHVLRAGGDGARHVAARQGYRQRGYQFGE